MDVHISERYSNTSLCFHKHRTWIMTTCGVVHVESCRHSTLEARYKGVVKHHSVRATFAAEPKRRHLFNKDCVDGG